MITMTTISLGALDCAAAGHVGSGAQAVFGGGLAMRWSKPRQNQVSVVRVSDLIPTNVAYTGTRLSAPPERSP